MNAPCFDVPSGPPDPVPNPAHDIIAQDFGDLAAQLGA